VTCPPADTRGYFESRLADALILLRQLVELESYTRDKKGVDALAGFLAAEFRARGATAELLPMQEVGDILVARCDSRKPGAPVMVLGHLDTVWPPGTLAARPFSIREGRAYGPGIFDMKSGILLCLLACQAFREGRCKPAQDVIFYFLPDEEMGVGAGLPLLEQAARRCRAVLCLEPPLPGGRAKTSRKGAGEFRLVVEGIPAHAGLDPDKGASAIVELSRLVLQMQSMNEPAAGATVNVGLIRGGSAANVVAGSAEAMVDFRFTTAAQGEALAARILSLGPEDRRCRVRLEGGIRRPPLERTDGVRALYEKARIQAEDLGMPFGEGSSGGSSDGSFTASLGVPTLDGLGVDGDGAHAAHEHVRITDIPPRAALLCELLRSI
jgi:glutamate carboxypeptidase